MKKYLLLFCFVVLAVSVFAQNNSSGNIYASGSTCSTTGACVTMSLPGNAGTVGIQVSGTFSATLQFEGSANGGVNVQAINCYPTNSTTAATSTTSSGVWRCAVSGLNYVQVRGSSYVSGQASVNIISSPAAASLNQGGGGTSVQVNGSSVSNPNFNGTTPAAGAGNTNVSFQVSGSSVSGEVPTFAGAGTANDVAGYASTGSAVAPLDTGVFTYVPSTHTLNVGSGGVNSAGPVSSGTAPTACGSASACFAGTEASTAGTPTAGQSYMRFSSTAHNLLFSFNNGAEGPLPVNSGGTGAATLTGPIKGNGTSAMTAAVASDIVGLFSTCSGTQYLGADGACHTAGSSTVTSWRLQDNGAGTSVGGPSAANKARFWPFYVAYPLTIYNWDFYVVTPDNSANAYDIGVYGCTTANAYTSNASSASVSFHTGSIAGNGTLLGGTSGLKSYNVPSGPVVLQPGWYAMVLGTNAASPTLAIGGTATAVFDLPFNSVGIGDQAIVWSSGLPSTITCPTASWQIIGSLWAAIHY